MNERGRRAGSAVATYLDKLSIQPDDPRLCPFRVFIGGSNTWKVLCADFLFGWSASILPNLPMKFWA